MLILAFDTSGTIGSAALLEGTRVIAMAELDRARKSAQSLAPAFRRLLDEAGIRPPDIRLIATTIGPGSFTGLRIGVTAAKTFAYAAGAHLIGLSTLEVIAAAVPVELLAMQRQVQAIIDAQRGDLFVGRFCLSPPGEGSHELPQIDRLAPDQLMSEELWRRGLIAGSIVTGGGLRRLSSPPGDIQCVDEAYWEPRAAIIGRLAWRHYQAGRRDDLWKLAPDYLRLSYAEEKAAAEQAAVDMDQNE